MRSLDGIAVDRLVARARQATAAAVREEITRRLGSADVRLPGTPSSILIVRALRDPLPGGISPSRGTHVADPCWTRAFGDRLREVHASAGRPARRAVPADAAAVLFADEAEMLACLLEDLVLGRQRDRWWWSTLLHRVSPPPDVENVLVENPRIVPAVFRVLADRGSAVAVCRILTAQASVRILRAVLAEYAVENLLAVLESWVTERTDTPGPSERTRPRPVQTRGAPLDIFLEYAVPPEAGIELPAANAVLLGAALALHRSPDSLATSVAAAAPDSEATTAQGSPPGGQATEIATDGHADLRDDSEQIAAERFPVRTVPSADEAEIRLRRSDRPGMTDPNGTPPVRGSSSGDATENSEIEIRPAPPSSGSVEPDGAITRWGGALYLVNVMDRLGLPELFEPDWPLSTGLSRWALLELLTRGILAAAGRSTADDAMFDALRALDARDDPLPGAGFPECFDWRLPASWRAAITDPAETLRYAVDDGTLSIWSPGGYTISSVATREPAARALRRERDVLRGAMPGVEIARGPVDDVPRADVEALRDAGLDRSLLRWLELTLPALVVRIGSALGWSGTDHGAVVDELIALPGRLHVTSTRVDLVVPLEAVRLAVRVAGFDLDPGWRPELGRVVRFHFESGGGYR